MANQLICIRVAQRALPYSTEMRYERFPFDRFYLCPTAKLSSLRRIFRYFLTLPLDEELQQALRALKLQHIKNTPVIRDDRASEKRELPEDNSVLDTALAITDEWSIIVPTHVKNTFKAHPNKRTPDKGYLGYVLTSAIFTGHNTKIRLPQITLHAPDRTVPILCALCRNLLGLHNGDCVPGRGSCKDSQKINVAPDTYFYQKAEAALHETGGVK